jgi:hypothetical protein
VNIETACKALEIAIERCIVLQDGYEQCACREQRTPYAVLEHLDLLNKAFLRRQTSKYVGITAKRVVANQ